MTTTTDYDSIITQRAVHFGRGDRHGGWMFAADVACCVWRAPGRGRSRAVSAVGKVTAAEFAEQAGCSDSTVADYLTGWDMAASRGLVVPADNLLPGDDPELPSAEQWEALRQDPDGPWARRQRPAPIPAGAPPVPGSRTRAVNRRRGARALLTAAEKEIKGAVLVLMEEPSEVEEISASIARIRADLDTAEYLIGRGAPGPVQ